MCILFFIHFIKNFVINRIINVLPEGPFYFQELCIKQSSTTRKRASCTETAGWRFNVSSWLGKWREPRTKSHHIKTKTSATCASKRSLAVLPNSVNTPRFCHRVIWSGESLGVRKVRNGTIYRQTINKVFGKRKISNENCSRAYYCYS